MRYLLGLFLSLQATHFIEASKKVGCEIAEEILLAAKFLGLRNLHIVGTEGKDRCFFGKSLTVKVTRDHFGLIVEPGESIVFLQNEFSAPLDPILAQMVRLRQSSNQWLLVERGTSLMSALAPEVEVDREVFFLDLLNNGTISEAYTVNNERVIRTIGSFELNYDGGRKYRKVCRESFLERRSSDFRGLQLKALTETQTRYIRIPNLRNMRSQDEGWNLLDRKGNPIRSLEGVEVSGILHDMLRTLERDMNFTTVIFVTKRGSSWGYRLPNGTWVGIIGSAVEGEVDFVAASLSINPQRFRVLDFLHRMGTETMAVFVSRGVNEEHAWKSFLYPLKPGVWYCALGMSCLLFVVAKFVQFHFCGFRPEWAKHTLLDFWHFGTAFFGGKAKLEVESQEKKLREILFAVTFCGMVVFIAYRASLTAELAVKRSVMPFNTLDELYESSYRLITFGPQLRSLKNGAGPNRKLYEVSMKEGEDKVLHYRNPYQSLAELLANPYRAMFFLRESMYVFPQYRCILDAPWVSDYSGGMSFGFPKNSPYFKLINYRLLKRLESGTLRLLQDRYFELSLGCEAEQTSGEREASSFYKMISVFAVACAGAVGATVVFFWEVLLSILPYNRKDRSLGFLPSSSEEEEEEEEKRSYSYDFRDFLVKWRLQDREDEVAGDMELLIKRRIDEGMAAKTDRQKPRHFTRNGNLDISDL